MKEIYSRVEDDLESFKVNVAHIGTSLRPLQLKEITDILLKVKKLPNEGYKLFSNQSHGPRDVSAVGVNS